MMRTLCRYVFWMAAAVLLTFGGPFIGRGQSSVPPALEMIPGDPGANPPVLPATPAIAKADEFVTVAVRVRVNAESVAQSYTVTAFGAAGFGDIGGAPAGFNQGDVTDGHSIATNNRVGPQSFVLTMPVRYSFCGTYYVSVQGQIEQLVTVTDGCGGSRQITQTVFGGVTVPVTVSCDDCNPSEVTIDLVGTEPLTVPLGTPTVVKFKATLSKPTEAEAKFFVDGFDPGAGGVVVTAAKPGDVDATDPLNPTAPVTATIRFDTPGPRTLSLNVRADFGTCSRSKYKTFSLIVPDVKIAFVDKNGDEIKFVGPIDSDLLDIAAGAKSPDDLGSPSIGYVNPFQTTLSFKKELDAKKPDKIGYEIRLRSDPTKSVSGELTETGPDTLKFENDSVIVELLDRPAIKGKAVHASVQANLIIQALGKTFVDRQVLLRQAPDADAYQNEVVEVLGTFPGITKSKDSLTLNRVAWGGHVLADVQLKETKKNSRVFRSADGAVTLSDVRLLSEDLADVPPFADVMSAVVSVPAWGFTQQPLRLEAGFTDPSLFENFIPSDRKVANDGGGRFWFPDSSAVTADLEFAKFYLRIYDPVLGSEPFDALVASFARDGSPGQQTAVRMVQRSKGEFRSAKPVLLVEGKISAETAEMMEQNYYVLPDSRGEVRGRTAGGAGAGEAKAFRAEICLVGDSLGAGFQHFAMDARWQANNFGSVLARQVKVGKFNLPLISPGVGLPSVTVDAARRKLTLNVDRARPPGQRIDAKEIRDANLIQNFAIPGANVGEILTKQEVPVDPKYPTTTLFPLVLQGKGLVHEQVNKQRPSLVIVLLGNNDLLTSALTGRVLDKTDDATLIPGALTDPANFKTQYGDLVKKLRRADEQPKADLVCVELPDLLRIPSLFPLPSVLDHTTMNFDELEIGGINGAQAFMAVFFAKKDTVPITLTDRIEKVPGGKHKPGTKVSSRVVLQDKMLVTMGAVLLFTGGDEAKTKVQAKKAFANGLEFDGDVVLTKNEQDRIAQYRDSYNAAIVEAADSVDGITVPLEELFNKAGTNSALKVGTHTLNLSFNGGLFSFDGIHPSNTAHALIANEILQAIHSELTVRDFGGFRLGDGRVRKIPEADLVKIYDDDPVNRVK